MMYQFTKKNKLIAVVMMVIGLAAIAYGFSQDVTRTWANILMSNFYFMAIALAGTFFIAVNYVSQAGWAVVVKRVPEAMGQFLPFAAVVMLIIFFFGGHDLYHWTHHYLYDKTDIRYDAIMDGKSAYLNTPFFVIRMVAYFVIWIGFTYLFRRESLQEDLNGGMSHYNKSVRYGAAFLILFAITSSTSAWDFIMSIDGHWFSTMFGWYTFAGLFVSGIVMMIMWVLYLKGQGHLENVNENHLHDLAKFMFAFSVFWTYLWFCQYMLIWYANIPEEVTYFAIRIDHYGSLFAFNIFVNFMFPILVLMTRNAKRKRQILMLTCAVLFIGHWTDLFVMIMPGTVGEHWHIGFIEIGTLIGFLGAFLYSTHTALTKASTSVKNHPLLPESVHHHI